MGSIMLPIFILYYIGGIIMNEKMQAKMEEIRQLYNEGNVGFQRLKDNIMFGDFSMGEIVTMYGALTHEFDGEEIDRIDDDKIDGIVILETFGWD
jgi:hypothetical protein